MPRCRLVRRSPDLVVEVLSAWPPGRRRDGVERAAEKAASDVRWCWLVGPEAGTLDIFERGAALWAGLDGLIDEDV